MKRNDRPSHPHETADHRPLKQSRGTDEVDCGPLTSGEDRVSSLPDDVILSIFSSLPFEEWSSLPAVSRRWRCLTRLLPRCDFFHCNSTTSDNDLPRAFIRRLHMVNLKAQQDHRLPLIIKHAKDASVEELVVECNNDDGEGVFFMKGVPYLVYEIKTLRQLLIKHYALYSVSSKVVECTPLRSLTAESCSINKGAIESILARCWRLETLHLLDCIGFAKPVISSRSLKNLRLSPRTKGIYSLDIVAPNLKVLILELQWIKLDELKIYAPNVRELCLNIPDPSKIVPKMDGFIEFLLNAEKLTSLTLNAAATELLAAECMELKMLSTFQKMKLLKVSLDIRHETEVLFLLKILEKCPRLSQLNLHVIEKQSIKRVINFDVLPGRLNKLQFLPGHLRQVHLDLDLIVSTYYDQELLQVILTEAKALKNLQLMVPGQCAEKMVKFLLSLKAPQREELDFINGRLTIRYKF